MKVHLTCILFGRRLFSFKWTCEHACNHYWSPENAYLFTKRHSIIRKLVSNMESVQRDNWHYFLWVRLTQKSIHLILNRFYLELAQTGRLRATLPSTGLGCGSHTLPVSPRPQEVTCLVVELLVKGCDQFVPQISRRMTFICGVT
jgi:hypothetical protein